MTMKTKRIASLLLSAALLLSLSNARPSRLHGWLLSTARRVVNVFSPTRSTTGWYISMVEKKKREREKREEKED